MKPASAAKTKYGVWGLICEEPKYRAISPRGQRQCHEPKAEVA
jgi:hypothetical protein